MITSKNWTKCVPDLSWRSTPVSMSDAEEPPSLWCQGSLLPKGSIFLDFFNYPLSHKFPGVQVKGDLSSSQPSCLLLYCLSVSNLFQFFLSLSASGGLFFFFKSPENGLNRPQRKSTFGQTKEPHINQRLLLKQQLSFLSVALKSFNSVMRKVDPALKFLRVWFLFLLQQCDAATVSGSRRKCYLPFFFRTLLSPCRPLIGWRTVRNSQNILVYQLDA